METTAIVISSILGYIAAGTWMYGYLNTKWANEYNLQKGEYDKKRDAEYYRDISPISLLASVFWPLYFFGGMLQAVHRSGEKVANKAYQKAKIRIESEKKMRIEEQEAEEELEDALNEQQA